MAGGSGAISGLWAMSQVADSNPVHAACLTVHSLQLWLLTLPIH